ncbi:uncharacterized protein LOC118429613 [Branchiostoma floridae]|uniref:Uncharacterized protein LOC118429613 n=1 Tax=Branchiostoma floridae TaxID=7739 RepID=A0A9J7N7I2_BRAFL|nr:uncharacterized protein LOC118429613 [Branchiostoma floridae]
MAAESTLLIANREELVKNIRFVEPFLDKLLQTNQLTGEESEVVRSGKTPQDRARALIDLVGTKGQDAFGHFRHALKETNPELADILHRCTDHNEKIKLHCDDCVQLLCRKCNKEGHRGHSVSSIVADAAAIRREVTAFVRDNRKVLKNFKASANDVGSRGNVLLDIELRKNALKAMFIAKIESEFGWCRDQLGVGERAASPAPSISSVATSITEYELSGRHGADTGCVQTTNIWRGVRNHPYSRVDQRTGGSHPRFHMKHLLNHSLPPSQTLSSLNGFTSPTSSSRSPFPSMKSLPSSSSPIRYAFPIPVLPFTTYSPSVRYTPTSRSPLSPISFPGDNNSPTQGPRHSAPSVHGQRESFSQPTPPAQSSGRHAKTENDEERRWFVKQVDESGLSPSPTQSVSKKNPDSESVASSEAMDISDCGASSSLPVDDITRNAAIGLETPKQFPTADFLHSFGKPGSRKGHFFAPKGLAICPKGGILVADSWNHRVQLFDINGKWEGEISTKWEGEISTKWEGEISTKWEEEISTRKRVISPPIAVTFRSLNPTGDVIVTCPGMGEVLKLPLCSGKVLPKLYIAGCRGVAALDKGHTLILSEGVNNTVAIYARGGDPVSKTIKYTKTNTLKTPFSVPRNINTDGLSNIYVSDIGDRTVKVLNKEGHVKVTIGKDILRYPTGVCADMDGNVIVADERKNTLEIFASDGHHLDTLISKQEGLMSPQEIALTPDGTKLVVVDGGNHRVLVYRYNHVGDGHVLSNKHVQD